MAQTSEVRTNPFGLFLFVLVTSSLHYSILYTSTPLEKRICGDKLPQQEGEHCKSEGTEGR